MDSDRMDRMDVNDRINRMDWNDRINRMDVNDRINRINDRIKKKHIGLQTTPYLLTFS